MKATKRLLATTLVLLLISAILSACAQSPASTASSQSSQTQQSSNAEPPKPIWIPLIGPMTGDTMQYGISVEIGIKLRVEEFNAAGGLNGRMIEIDTYDDKGDVKETVNIANKLLDNPDLFLVLGPFASTSAMAISPILQKAEVLQYALNASHPDATQAGEWIFRGPVTQAEVQKQYAAFAYNKLGHRTVGLLYLNTDWGKSVNDVFCDEFVKLGGTITDSESFMEGQTKDFTPMLSKIKDNNPDAVYLIGQYNDCATMLNQMATLDFQSARYVADSAARPELFDLAGENVEGAYWILAFYLENPNPVFKELRQKVLDRTGKDIDSFVTHAYDNMGVVCRVLTDVGEVDKYKLRERWANLKDYDGLAGQWGFDETRSPNKPLYILTAKNGEVVLYE